MPSQNKSRSVRAALSLICITLLFAACTKSASAKSVSVVSNNEKQTAVALSPKVAKFYTIYSQMGSRFKQEVQIPDEKIEEFLGELENVIALDTENLLMFCSKQKLLPSTYEPQDLIPVKNTDVYVVNRNDLNLRKPVYDALYIFASEAKKDGIQLDISSTYRSYKYQENLYARNVRELGQEVADRESARPGSSQHQLGVVVDFGSVTDDYAKTKACQWLNENCERLGWSLSFPQGYEDVTGFRWECWQFRYIGKEAVSFQNKWFNNINHFMLEFIDKWKENKL